MGRALYTVENTRIGSVTDPKMVVDPVRPEPSREGVVPWAVSKFDPGMFSLIFRQYFPRCASRL